MSDENDYKKVKIKDIFGKELLITGTTFAEWTPKDEKGKEKVDETKPLVVFYAESPKTGNITFTTFSKVLIKQAGELKLPCSGKFTEEKGSGDWTYYNFVQKEKK